MLVYFILFLLIYTRYSMAIINYYSCHASIPLLWPNIIPTCTSMEYSSLNAIVPLMLLPTIYFFNICKSSRSEWPGVKFALKFPTGRQINPETRELRYPERKFSPAKIFPYTFKTDAHLLISVIFHPHHIFHSLFHSLLLFSSFPRTNQHSCNRIGCKFW